MNGIMKMYAVIERIVLGKPIEYEEE